MFGLKMIMAAQLLGGASGLHGRGQAAMPTLYHRLGLQLMV